jgi:hypothetical protein
VSLPLVPQAFLPQCFIPFDASMLQVFEMESDSRGVMVNR